MGLNGFPSCSCLEQAETTESASSAAPFPPFENPSKRTMSTAPALVASSLIASISASVSVWNLFIDTTTGMSVIARFLTCLLRFEAAPARTASTFSVSISSLVGLEPPPPATPPPCNFIDLTVTLRTIQLGATPDARALMWRAFSAPISAPNPASVTT